LPEFLEACFGVWNGQQVRSPFVSPCVASEIVDGIAVMARLPPSLSVCTNSAEAVSGAHKGPGPVLLEGMLRVLCAVGSRRGSRRGSGKGSGVVDSAMEALEARAVQLLLVAFQGCCCGGRVERVWRDHGSKVLMKIVSLNHFQGGTLERSRGREVWDNFLEGAVEYTRLAIEGKGDGGGGGGRQPVQDSGEVSTRRAAVLMLELVKLQEEVWTNLQGGVGNCCSHGVGDEPVLWRLGLTNPVVWQHRRKEALTSATDRESRSKGREVGALIHSLNGSRWKLRWDCLSCGLGRLSSPSERLLLLLRDQAKASVDGVGLGEGCIGGEVLYEVLMAGVVFCACLRQTTKRRSGHDSDSSDLGPNDLPTGLGVPLPLPGSTVNRSDTSTGGNGGGASKGACPADFGIGCSSWRGGSFENGGGGGGVDGGALGVATRTMATELVVSFDGAVPIASGEVGAWFLCCAAEVIDGLSRAVLGEAFVNGLDLGVSANR
ncbi:unnamed protein product, partial [Choristocarpus tenellus]